MIGADETVVLDRHWNAAFVGSATGAAKFMADAQALGFSVAGDQVMATKRELEAAFFTPVGRALRSKGCDHDWRPIPMEGPKMKCGACGREEY